MNAMQQSDDPVIEFSMIERPADLSGRKSWDVDKYTPQIVDTIRSKRVGRFVLRLKDANKWRMSLRNATETHPNVKLRTRKVNTDDTQGSVTLLLWAEEVKK